MRLAPVFALVVLLVSLFGCGGSQKEEEEATAGRPNILLVLTDDQPAATVAEMPQVQAHLVDEGLSFTRAFISHPRCCPSRATILTGRHPHNHGIITNHEPEGGAQGFAEKGLEEDTIATRLKEAGYATGYFGKYFNGYDGGRVPPGWDEWAALSGSVGGDTYRVDFGGETETIRREEWHPTDLIGGHAEMFVKTHAQEPWFAYIAPLDPHGPYYPAPRHAHDFDGVQLPDKPSFDRVDPSQPSFVRELPPLSDAQKGELRQTYEDKLEALQAVDDLVAEMVETLEATGELEHTYIFFMTDNGVVMGEHRFFDKKKGTPYEEAVKTPLLVRGPGVPAGESRTQLASNVDLAPTFAELADTEPPAKPDGRSLVPLLSGDKPASWREAVLLKARNRYPLSFSGLRTPRYAYFEYENGEEELYDMRSDPYQLQSIHQSADPELLEDLRGRLRALEDCAGAGCREAEEP
jgi:arylsulfatase A-like enzyme